MDNLKPCPFCGGAANIVCDNDEEVGADWYACRCDDCCAQSGYSTYKEEAVDAWDHRAESDVDMVTREEMEEEGRAGYVSGYADGIAKSRPTPANAPLTLDELREMDGEPVWIVAHPDWGHWELSADAEDYFADKDEDFYGMMMPPALPDPMGRYGLHMMGWLAYRCKPATK